jgi:hypothetical protein
MVKKTISFEYKKWMTFAIAACCCFAISFIIATHFPDCSDCTKYQNSFLQVWLGVVSLINLLGTIIFTIISFLAADIEG